MTHCFLFHSANSYTLLFCVCGWVNGHALLMWTLAWCFDEQGVACRDTGRYFGRFSVNMVVCVALVWFSLLSFYFICWQWAQGLLRQKAQRQGEAETQRWIYSQAEGQEQREEEGGKGECLPSKCIILNTPNLCICMRLMELVLTLFRVFCFSLSTAN